eukprot:GEMP01045744.1.p2 GENE.GEMP01045744.1~~GEMP01045744.1.p2  ORF type:complete len:228 (+),score=43.87 GEMP01045744.1:22-684(+)
MTETGAALVHNFDQRQRTVAFEGECCDGTLVKVNVSQHGASSREFVSGTSSVVWPVAVHMCRWLCQHPELIEGKSVVELGSGTGLVGLTASQMRPRRILLTDSEIGILRENCVGCETEVGTLLWGDAHNFGTFDVVLMSDLICNQEKETMEWLVNGMVSVSHEDTLHLLAYEHRDDWFTMTAFFEVTESKGFVCESEPLGDEEDDFLLYKLRLQKDHRNP